MPTPLPPSYPSDDQDARTERHLAFLDTLIAHGMDLASRVHQQSTTPSDLCSALAAPGDAIPFITPDVIASFAQINQTVRRAILLSRKLAEPLPLAPAKPGPRDSEDRAATRNRIIRDVEAAIRREAHADARDGLRAELHERVETGDLDDNIGKRPVEEIITEICRDLGVNPAWEQGLYKRRTPEDVRILNAHAARPSRPAQPSTPAPRPAKPPFNAPSDTEPGDMVLPFRGKPKPRPQKT